MARKNIQASSAKKKGLRSIGNSVDPSIGVGKRTSAQSAKLDSVRNQPKRKGESTSCSNWKKKQKVVDLDPDYSDAAESDGDSDDEGDGPASSFVPQGNFLKISLGMHLCLYFVKHHLLSTGKSIKRRMLWLIGQLESLISRGLVCMTAFVHFSCLLLLLILGFL